MDITANLPPCNLEAESAVLGSLVAGYGVYDQVSSILEPDDFYNDAHKIIYQAVQHSMEEHHRCDIILVNEEIKRMGKDKAVGGINYVNSLADQASVVDNVEAHAKIIVDAAQKRRLIEVGRKIASTAYDGKESAEDLVATAEQLVLGVSGKIKSNSSFTQMRDVVSKSMTRLMELQNYEGLLTGLSTGFTDLDQVTNGLQNSDLIIIAARPSMGKTAFTLNLAQNITLQTNKTVAFFSLEMSEEQLVNRVISSVSGVSSEKLRRAQMEQDDWSRIIKATEAMSQARLFIYDSPNLTIPIMRSELRRLKVEQGLDLIILDYIQLMTGRANSDNRQQEVSEISRNLKVIAREFNVPVIALSQLSRSVDKRDDKRPVLSDLRESGSLEQDADIVAFLYREKYYDENTDKGDVTEIIIRKHRNGSLKTVDLMFEPEYTRFRSVSYKNPGSSGGQ